MSFTATDTPTWACHLHAPPAEGKPWAPADPNYKTCGGCLNRLRATLTEIATLYAGLDATPGANNDRGGRGAPGFTSKPAANLNVVVMRDRRSLPYETAPDAVQYVWDPNADDGEGAYTERREVWLGADGRGHTEQAQAALSVPATLAGIAAGIADLRDLTTPHGNVPELARWLDTQLDWLTRQEWIAEPARDLHRLAAQLRGINEPRRRVGRCPNTLDEGDTTRTCGAALYAPIAGDTIRCNRCGRAWARAEWLRLGELLRDAS